VPKVDLSAIPQTNRTGYLPPHGEKVAGRNYRRVAQALGLTDFGVSEVTLEPGAWSSQRHWHEGEDEIVVMIEGEAVLVEEEGETVMRAGDIAAFAKGVANGHHLINRSATQCRFVAVGKPSTTDCHYPDIDMHLIGADQRFIKKSERKNQ
jgi:uncharacterized cupin superfamily protein